MKTNKSLRTPSQRMCRNNFEDLDQTSLTAHKDPPIDCSHQPAIQDPPSPSNSPSSSGSSALSAGGGTKLSQAQSGTRTRIKELEEEIADWHQAFIDLSVTNNALLSGKVADAGNEMKQISLHCFLTV